MKLKKITDKEFKKFADYKNTEDYRQRAYNKLMGLTTWIMMNNYANSQNPQSYRVRVKEIRSYFERKAIREAIECYDRKNQKLSYQYVHFLLLHRCYYLFLLISVLHEKIK